MQIKRKSLKYLSKVIYRTCNGAKSAEQMLGPFNGHTIHGWLSQNQAIFAAIFVRTTFD